MVGVTSLPSFGEVLNSIVAFNIFSNPCSPSFAIVSKILTCKFFKPFVSTFFTHVTKHTFMQMSL